MSEAHAAKIVSRPRPDVKLSKIEKKRRAGKSTAQCFVKNWFSSVIKLKLEQTREEAGRHLVRLMRGEFINFA